MKRVLVTGAAGFIGSHIVDECIDRGWKVFGIDNLSTGRKENINQKIDCIVGDIQDTDFDSLFGKVDVIFHTAAKARIQPSFTHPIEYHTTNVIGTIRLIKYAIACDAKLIFSSSSSVYGVKGSLSSPMDESYPLNPSSPYALQKLFCEQYLEMFHKVAGLKYVALRYFNVYGPRQINEGAYAAVVGIFMDQLRRNIPFTIYGDGEQKRDFTFVKDVVNANLLAFESEIDNGVYNIGTGVNHSVNELANYISLDNSIKYLPERLGEAKETLADYRKAFTAFGWKPEVKLNEWIKSAVSTT